MKSSTKDYGLTSAGLKIKPFDVIVTEIQDELTAKLGKINLNPPSVFSIIINIFAEREALIWQLAEQTYNSQYPGTAEGISLDNVCAITGLARLVATNSYVLAQVTAINYTMIPQGSEIRVENTSNILSLHTEVTINNNSCTSILLQIHDVNLESYTISIDGANYTYARQQDDTIAVITEKLKEALETNNSLIIDITTDDSSLKITSISPEVSFSCFVSQGLEIVNCTNSAYFIAKAVGAIPIPAGSANVIETPIAGWISVSNMTAGFTGRNLETDIEFRARREASLRLSGSGTIEAMKARLLSINSVTYADVIDNRTNVTVGDLPPKSFKAMVVGGTDFEVGQAIWQAQPIGIESVGNTSVIVKDAANKEQAVKFSRPLKVPAYINIVLTVSELFIDDSMDAIKQAIVKRIQGLKLGGSLILQSLYSDIYSVPSIKNAAITMGKSYSNLVAQDITVGASEIITIDQSNIIISKV